ncbi:glycoside hydrolase family 97 catalytic domain-containing protein [Dysgonomonas sp. 520]|uniref:glycoside hydrolase family 97 catalytic domain-containing protein n=1 Tax=Dysgonomonas sp. 520 TaxID=2302931 RepID=UPI0013D841C8|nr:glycoside hydrolase family 97 catalytic domain-containing protein [Dysgonomonas sp. 520]NDW08580.1 T9SS C-terminal target domain-containing protein [Dysgonomonas sp. 520]
MNKFLFFTLFFVTGTFTSLWAADYDVISPNKQIKMKLHVDGGTTYEVWHGETQLIKESAISLNLSDGMVIGAGSIKKTSKNTVNSQIDVVVGKNKTLTEAYNELTIEFKENYSLIVRAYDEGVAYRFVTNLDKDIVINSETAIFNFVGNTKVYFPECDTNTSQETGDNGVKYNIHQGFRNFERIYNTYNIPGAIGANKFSVTPVLFEFTSTPYKLVVTEADTYDYPGMYMEHNDAGGNRSMRGMWAKYPKKVMDPNNYYSNHLVYERENFIVKTTGARTFPWRVIIPVDEDKDLLNNELVYMLSEPCKIADTSWIKPGKTAWEWWHKAMLEGVDFPVGNNNLSVQLYKYYIDWASENGLEYMTFDAGYHEDWLFELCDYAKTKNVKIIVWTWASCVNEYSGGDWIKKMKAYGVAGVKIDFFERNDQIAMRWGHEFAERLAKSKMVALYHGCPVPTGLSRTYPNILNYEAVRGAEDNFWRSIVTPNYHTQFPFIRALAGPYDYTPGSLRNKTAAEFYPVDKDNTVPMSMGTRAHELSMYVIFDQWLGYLCDSPTEYNKYPDILDFLRTVPTVWDKTVPLDSKLGEYILMAKQKGLDWYIGGMSNWDERWVDVDFSFLADGVTYNATILKDAPSSSTKPTEYKCEEVTITKDTKLTIRMAKGGGFAIRLKDPSGSGIADNDNEKTALSISVDKATSTLSVKSKDPIQSIQVYNNAGQCLISRNVAETGFTSQDIDLSGVGKGFYILKADTKNKTFTEKFIY